jgi:hypothetical protein
LGDGGPERSLQSYEKSEWSFHVTV